MPEEKDVAKGFIYAGASTLISLTQQERDILTKPISYGDCQILPTGEAYMPQVYFRRQLNASVGPGQWALVPVDSPKVDTDGDQLSQTWALYIRGHFIAQATGEAGYFEESEKSSIPTSIEAAKSNALMRCCKDLSVASECWDIQFTRIFMANYCIRVWCEGVKKPLWRRIDAPKFWNEKGPVQGEEEKIAKWGIIQANGPPTQIAGGVAGKLAEPPQTWIKEPAVKMVDAPVVTTVGEALVVATGGKAEAVGGPFPVMTGGKAEAVGAGKKPEPVVAMVETQTDIWSVIDLAKTKEVLALIPAKIDAEDAKQYATYMLDCWPVHLHNEVISRASKFKNDKGEEIAVKSLADFIGTKEDGTPIVSDAWSLKVCQKMKSALTKIMVKTAA